MLKYITCIDKQTGEEWIETNLSGKALLNTPLLNKGTAFTEKERHELKLLGKLPFHVETLEEQLSRAKSQYLRYSSTLQKFIYLNNLHDKNEILFYRLLQDDLAEFLPKIYTPGVGYAIKEFSHEFRQPRGLYISYPDRNKISEILDNRTHAEIDIIVATDGERILGIGDQGIGGMDIPIAKLVVYSLCGVNPYRTLPIMLDVGTDNPQLLNDPLYLGWRHPRIKEKEYDDFIQTFVRTVHAKFPNSLVQWEDFGLKNARRILEKYRESHCTFNDDMQGTGVVTLAALLVAIQATKIPIENHRIIIFGAGTAGVGIAEELYRALVRQGVDPQIARRQFWLIDKAGLLIEEMSQMASFQKHFARPKDENAFWQNQGSDLLSVVKAIFPTILIGCSTVRNAFTEDIVRAMAQHVERPIIFPLSNPTENCEANPENLLHWTNGKALIAAGSPFEAVNYKDIIYRISQCNNAFSFPGIGIGAIATQASQVTDNMLWAATQAITEYASFYSKGSVALLPQITEIATVAGLVGLAVAKQAIEDKVARRIPKLELSGFIQENIWHPFYRPIKFVKEI